MKAIYVYLKLGFRFKAFENFVEIRSFLCHDTPKTLSIKSCAQKFGYTTLCTIKKV